MLPAIANGLRNIISKPGDRMEARITETGKQVVKLTKDGIKQSAVHYPSTGTTVYTVVKRD